MSNVGSSDISAENGNYPTEASVVDLCTTLTSSTLNDDVSIDDISIDEDVSIDAWLKQIVADKTSLGKPSLSTSHQERSKTSAIFEDLSEFIGFVMNCASHCAVIKNRMTRNSEQDNEVKSILFFLSYILTSWLIHFFLSENNCYVLFLLYQCVVDCLSLSICFC